MRLLTVIACMYLSLFVTRLNASDFENGSKELYSPNGEYSFKLVETKTLGQEGLVIYRSHDIISDSVYFLGGDFVNGLWNSKLTYVCINNRQSDGGDYIWIFSLQDGLAIKQPDNNNVITICSQIGKSNSNYSFSNLRNHYSFSYKWKSDNELLVCTILISDLDHQGICVAYDTYTIGKYGGYSITGRTINMIPSTAFNTLPKITTDIWSGWKSTWWSSVGTEPSAKM